MAEYANIIIDLAVEKLDKTFTYRVPEDMRGKLAVGMEVLVPFGAGGRQLHGYVLELVDQPSCEESRVKEIASLLPGSVSVDGQLLALAGWMHDTYGATMIQCVKTVMPVRRKIKNVTDRTVRLLVRQADVPDLLAQFQKKNARAKARLLQAFSEEQTQELPYEAVTKKLHISTPTLKSMAAEGLIEIAASIRYRNPVVHMTETQTLFALHESQQRVVDAVMGDFADGLPGTYLIHGVTGSGKTEIYIEIAARMAQRGRQTIVLIPEIALTYQTMMRFYRRFGGRVSFLNSRMSAGERFDQFERARRQELDVMIGPRSALFTPFSQLGAIIIDEEHEGAYKSETMPCYHARETAIARAKLCGASVVLGSATPSLEAYTKAVNGEYQLFTLNERRGDAVLPKVEIIDLREELKSGNRSMFGRTLQEAIGDRLQKKEQTMLFLNRRGFAGFVSCRECGHVMKCPHCDVSLSFHKDGRLHCHYCGYQTPMAKLCPQCGSRYIGAFRAGTQQVEEAVQKLFPAARVLRMDMDTTRAKGGHEAVLERFANHEADILVGTQMIVKGHDFKNVTLMGVLAADMSLLASDYRAAERTFQLLAQAAGRAGRSCKPGRVLIQTYQPEHYAILCAASHDYRGFYAEEMSYRMLAGYPPASHMLAILITSADEAYAKKLAILLRQTLDTLLAGRESECMGPAPAGIAKLRDVYKWTIYVKDGSVRHLAAVRRALEAYMENSEYFTAGSVQFDLDPLQTI